MCLVLFVGFIFGLIVGFVAKDPIVHRYSKVITPFITDKQAVQNDRGAPVKVSVEEKVIAVPEKKAVEKKADEKKADEKKADEKKADEKKEEEKKPEEKKAE